MRKTIAFILTFCCLMTGMPFSAYAETVLTAEEIALLTATPEESVYAESEVEYAIEPVQDGEEAVLLIEQSVQQPEEGDVLTDLPDAYANGDETLLETEEQIDAGLEELTMEAVAGELAFEMPDESVPAEETVIPEEEEAGTSLAQIPMTLASYDENGFWIEDGVLKGYNGDSSTIVIPEGITEIADRAFSVTNTLTQTRIASVTFPSTLKRIGSYAFYGCNLQSLSFPDGLEEIAGGAFYECKKITSLSFPDSLKTIGNSAFEYCERLKELNLGNGLEHIGNKAFRMHRIAELVLPASLKTIGESAFYTDNRSAFPKLVIPEGVVSIGASAFSVYEMNEDENCFLYLPESLTEMGDKFFKFSDSFNHIYENVFVFLPEGSAAHSFFEKNGYPYYLSNVYKETDGFIIGDGELLLYTGNAENVVIPDGVTHIADKAFMKNSTITSVRFPESLIKIGYSAFSDCINLKDVVLPPKLKTLDTWAFADCTSLTHIEFPDSVKDLGIGTLQYCSALESVVLPAGITHLSDTFKACTSLKNVNLPDGLTHIDGAFSSCSSLESIRIPASVKEIGHMSFFKCSSLVSVELPKKLKYLGDSVFEKCTSLKTVIMPTAPQRLGYELFMDCTSLVSFKVPSGTTMILDDCFNGCTSLKDLYVPSSVKTIGKSIFEGCSELNVRGVKGSKIQSYCKKLGVLFSTSNSNPALFTLAESKLTLGVDQSYMLNPVFGEEGDLEPVKYKSSSNAVKVDSSTGEITAKKTGSATITATASNGLKATCKVTVKAAPKKVSFPEDTLLMSLGEKYQLTVNLTKNSIASLTYTVKNPDVLSVSADGLVEAVGLGSAEVTVTTQNGKTDTLLIMVLDAPTAIYLDRSEITIRETTSDRIVPSVNEGGLCRNYSFESQDPYIVGVDAQGNITGVGRGTTVVYVTTENGLRAECSVTVIAPPPKLELKQSSITIGLKDKGVIEPVYIFEEAEYTGTYSYKVKSSKIASVNADGVVTAKKTGSTTVTVTTEDGLSAVCKIKVVKAPSSIKLAKKKLDLGLGEKHTLVWSLTKSTAASVRFSSSDENIVQVSADGVLNPVGKGTAKVTVTTFNGKKASCTVNVYAAPTGLGIGASAGKAEEKIVLAEGMKGNLYAVFREGEYGGVTFSSNYPEYLTVDPVTGEFKAQVEYFSHDLPIIVSVDSYNGMHAEATVEIQMAPPQNDLILKTRNLNMGVGDSYILSSNYTDAFSMNAISYKSSKSSVASVDANGKITAKKTGTATITATLYNGVSSKCKITVMKAPKSITMNAADVMYLGYDEWYIFNAVFSPAGSYSLMSYSSSDSELLSIVETSGQVHATKDSGVVTITAENQAGLRAECTVILDKAPTAISFPQNNITVPVGSEIPGYVQTEGGSCSTIYYGYSDHRLVSTEGNRMIAKKKGDLVVTARTYNDCTAKLNVTIVDAPSKCTLSLPKQMPIGSVLNIYDYFKSNPSYDPALQIKSVSVNNNRAELVESPYGVYLMPVKKGSFDVVVKTWGGKTLRATVKATDASADIIPEYSFPASENAEMGNYIGQWMLQGVSAAGGMLSYPPEMFGFKEWIMDINADGAVLTIDGISESADVSLDGNQLIIQSEPIEIRCILHTNGWISMPIYEDVTLWFAKQTA